MAIKTVDQILDDYNDYADYEETNSVSRARSFISACRRLIGIIPQSQSDQGSSMSMSVAQVESMMKHAQVFVEVNSAPSSAVRFITVSGDFR